MSEPSTPSATGTSAPSSRPRTVLVADDSRFFRTMLAYALDEEGIRCLSAATGREALATLEREAPDVELLLLDLVMPELNGFEVLERLRASARLRGLPVIVVTGYQLNELERSLLREHGVVAVLAKNVPVERLLFEVRQTLYPDESERRRTPRIPLSLPVTARTARSTWVTSTFNLSEEGMFLVLPDEEPPKEGTEVTLRFWVPDEDGLFEVASKVMWTNVAGASFRRTHPPGFGVRFAAADHPARDAIRMYLRSHV